ncbi:hypothetical protein XELAEV_18034504mg [Xenopus laevis]|uniref:Uncharacterized protein n=1 Tax=Xenopus laevis TaxID=8355 RepID=A0A974CE46_XENLA|nr:hypothetical protein XELAEV_18034504mg [Xenopus laevis]
MWCQVPFIALLLLSLVQEDSSYTCEIDEVGREILVWIDELAAAVNALLDTPEHKIKAEALSQMLRNMVCAGKISHSLFDSIKKMYEQIIYNIHEGTLTKEDITEFLDHHDIQQIEQFLEEQE